MGKLVEKLKKIVQDNAQEIKIVFAEGRNNNIQTAAAQIVKESRIVPILLFDKVEEIPETRNKRIKYISLDKVEISQYANNLYELRKSKGMTYEEAKQLVLHRNYFAALMVKDKKAHGEVCGIEYTTADTLRPALQIVKTDKDYALVSSAFIMEKGDESLIFGDCAINVDPNPEQLTSIAKSLARFSHTTLGLQQVRVALLSFSSNGSGRGPSVLKVQSAYQDLKKMNTPEIEYFGEVQFDAAYDDAVRAKKVPSLQWKGRPNVYIFPNLDAGNIGYKIAQRLGGYEAIGPILVGLAAPINDLSRGATTHDVVQLTYITAAQYLSMKGRG